MNTRLQKKINLLLHLAKVDGKFDQSERRVLADLLKEEGLDEQFLDTHHERDLELAALPAIADKHELFYWIMRMIKADGYLHPDEIAMAKAIAIKLGLNANAVDYFGTHDFSDLDEFRKTLAGL